VKKFTMIFERLNLKLKGLVIVRGGG